MPLLLALLACGPTAAPGDAALAALEPDEVVDVVEDDIVLSFLPTSPTSHAALVLYPGGLVDRAAYAPILRRVAEAGHAAFIVSVPSDLAIFGVNRAARPLDAHPELGPWVVGGHSLGGVAASTYALKDDRVRGVLLMAAYPAGGKDLSATDLGVTSITGTEDGVLDRDAYEEARARLPADTRYVVVEGANHAAFGDYGPQDGDGEATIPPEEVWDVVAEEATVRLDAADGV